MGVKKLRVVLRWTGGTLLVLLAILALFILEENIRGHIMLARYKAELRANGEKLTIEEFNFPKPPVEGNGAAELLSAATALNAMVLSNDSEFRDLASQKYTAPGKVLVWHRQQHLPKAEDWGSGGHYFVQRLDWGGLAAEITSNNSAIEQVKHALLQPALGFNIDYRKPGSGIPQFSALCAFRYWLSSMAISALHHGDHEAALNSVLVLAKLSSRIDEQVTLVQLSRAHYCRVGVHATWEALQDEGWTDDQLLQMQRAWESVDLLSSLPKTAIVERARDLIAWREITTWQGFGELFRYPDDSTWQIAWGTVIWGVWKAAWESQDELRMLEMWDMQREFFRNPSTVAFVPFERLMESRSDRFGVDWRHPYSQLDYSIPPAEDRLIVECETERQMALAAIALRRYRDATGRAPSSLTALVPAYLSSAPLDRMDGKPLRYQLHSDGTWILYSVGEDGIDDGGNPAPNFGYTLRNMWDGRDAVWPQPAL